MLHDPLIARTVSKVMLDVSGRLNDSVALVAENCPAEELEVYRPAVASVLAEMLLGILNPIYSEHPSLKPPDWE